MSVGQGAKGNEGNHVVAPDISANVPDSLHPTGRHPEGGCECTGAENDLPCEYHETAFDYAMQELNGLHEHRVIRSVVLRLRAEVRRLRELVSFRERECAIETEAKQKSWEAEAKLREENDRLRKVEQTLRENGVEQGAYVVRKCTEAQELREENAALRAEISAHRVAGVELAEENARLKYQVTLRDMQLSTHRELMAQAEAKSEELRGRWDRAETAREELQALVDKTRAIATQRVEAAHAKLARVEAVLRDNRALHGKWYVDAGTLVARIEAALKG